MSAGYKEYKVNNNEDLVMVFTVYEDDESTAIDLSSYTPYMSITDSDATEVLDCDTYVSITGDDNNVITVRVPESQISTLDVDTYYYDIVLTNGTITKRYVYGTIDVIQGYTSI